MSDPTRSPYEPEPTVAFDRGQVPPPYPQPEYPQPQYPQPQYPHPEYPQPDSPPRYPAPYEPARDPSVPGRSGYGQPNPYEQYPQPPYAPMVYLQPADPRQLAYQQSLYAAQKSRLAAGLLAIFLGSLGIHNFYLGRTGIAVTQLLITVLTLGLGSIITSVWALIEGILILTRSPSFVTDAKGIPLRD